MTLKSPIERTEILTKFAKKLRAGGGLLSLQQAYDVFKEIEAEMEAAEDDDELYNALLVVRKELKEAMQARAEELGESDHWTIAVKGHDHMLGLRPLFRAQDDPQEYVKVFRSLSPEQMAELEYWEKETGTHLTRPEVLEAELRWSNIRYGSILRLIPDFDHPTPTRIWSERLKAILLLLGFAVGLASAVESSSWVGVLVLLALFAVVVATWIRDFISFMRRKNSVPSPSK